MRATNSRASSSVKLPVRVQLPDSPASSAVTCAICSPSIVTSSASDASSASANVCPPSSVKLICMYGVPSSANPTELSDTSAPVSQTLPSASVNSKAFCQARNSATPSVSASAGRVTTTVCRSSGKSICAPSRLSCDRRCTSTVRTCSAIASSIRSVLNSSGRVTEKVNTVPLCVCSAAVADVSSAAVPALPSSAANAVVVSSIIAASRPLKTRFFKADSPLFVISSIVRLCTGLVKRKHGFSFDTKYRFWIFPARAQRIRPRFRPDA